MRPVTPSSLTTVASPRAIRYAIAPCALGLVLLAINELGVCAIFMGDEPQSLEQDLKRRFPNANRQRSDAELADLVARVVASIDAPHLASELPVEPRGTAFQARVWQALRAIPMGTTATYSEIARAIGAPTSFRAVAQACGANPVAVAIPCHRVVRTDGGISGYRWGVERKRALLAREAGYVATARTILANPA